MQLVISLCSNLSKSNCAGRSRAARRLAQPAQSKVSVLSFLSDAFANRVFFRNTRAAGIRMQRHSLDALCLRLRHKWQSSTKLHPALKMTTLLALCRAYKRC